MKIGEHELQAFKLATGDNVVGLMIRKSKHDVLVRDAIFYDVEFRHVDSSGRPVDPARFNSNPRLQKNLKVAVHVPMTPFIPGGEVNDEVVIPRHSIMSWFPAPSEAVVRQWHKMTKRKYIELGVSDNRIVLPGPGNLSGGAKE